MIKPEHWGDDQHTTLYMWDNVASGCADSVQLKPKQEGRIKIAITKTAVNSLIAVIVYGEFENMKTWAAGGGRRAAGGGRRAAERSTHIKDSVTSVVSKQKLRWKEFVDRKRF